MAETIALIVVGMMVVLIGLAAVIARGHKNSYENEYRFLPHDMDEYCHSEFVNWKNSWTPYYPARLFFKCIFVTSIAGDQK